MTVKLTDAERKVLDRAARIMDKAVREAPQEYVTNPDAVREYFKTRLFGKEAEGFYMMMLNNRHAVIDMQLMFHGTIDSSAVYPREIVKRVLECNAAAVIFAHNHPSGVTIASDADIRITRKLTDALALIDVRVLDHLIAGNGTITSMAEQGLM